jgi:ABC-type nitrate/sulfonate/bicarbonate transport system permease component
MPAGGRDFANIILGFLLGTAVATIISFFYGSSKSSKDKTDALVKEMK